MCGGGGGSGVQAVPGGGDDVGEDMGAAFNLRRHRRAGRSQQQALGVRTSAGDLALYRLIPSGILF